MSACPSLFQPTESVNGILSRIRVPLGCLNSAQIQAIAQITDTIHITNRANIQICTAEPLPTRVLKNLQSFGLVIPNPELDHLRNIMISPTAGIDPQALLDTRPLAMAWLKYLANHPELAILSPKFSIGIDGGELSSIAYAPNDICLRGLRWQDKIYFSLSLLNIPTGLILPKAQALWALATLAEIYRLYTLKNLGDRPPRFRDLIRDWGQEICLKILSSMAKYVDFEPQVTADDNYHHIGIHPQADGNFYLGIVIPLGRISTEQCQALAHTAPTIRLTHRQNIIIPNIVPTQLEAVQAKVAALGLSTSPHHPLAAMIACSGNTGCKSAVTDTQTDARAIATHLNLQQPLSIHVSGCEKSCAYHQPTDIKLVGIDCNTYQVFVKSELKGIYRNWELPTLIGGIAENSYG